MNTNMNGKLISRIIFSPESSYQICELRSDGVRQLSLSATHHGEYDQFWVIEKEGGREVRRYNPRLIETIEWSPESET